MVRGWLVRGVMWAPVDAEARSHGHPRIEGCYWQVKNKLSGCRQVSAGFLATRAKGGTRAHAYVSHCEA
jgi:hypothetical protein